MGSWYIINSLFKTIPPFYPQPNPPHVWVHACGGQRKSGDFLHLLSTFVLRKVTCFSHSVADSKLAGPQARLLVGVLGLQRHTPYPAFDLGSTQKSKHCAHWATRPHPNCLHFTDGQSKTQGNQTLDYNVPDEALKFHISCFLSGYNRKANPALKGSYNSLFRQPLSVPGRWAHRYSESTAGLQRPLNSIKLREGSM